MYSTRKRSANPGFGSSKDTPSSVNEAAENNSTVNVDSDDDVQPTTGILPKSFQNRRKVYHCVKCYKPFASLGAVALHRRGAHTFERPFQCAVCSFCFAGAKVLKDHLRAVHQKVKRYLCSRCPQGFFHITGLERHEETHDGVKSFVCEQCGKTYTRKWTLTNHVQTKHTVDGRRFECHLCRKVFKHKCHMKRHRLNMHPPSDDEAGEISATEEVDL